jgi:hypothetical protein
MVAPSFQREILEQLEQLAEVQQKQVLEFAQSLASSKPLGEPGANLLRWAGLIPPDDLREMERAIEEGCEQVDENGWQNPPRY